MKLNSSNSTRLAAVGLLYLKILLFASDNQYFIFNNVNVHKELLATEQATRFVCDLVQCRLDWSKALND